MNIKIIEASTESLDAFITLLDEVGEWLWNKGVKQWEPGEHREKEAQLRTLVERGCLVLAYDEERLAGGCILSEILPEEWPEGFDDGLVLGSFVVARFAAGQGIGCHIIQGAIDFAVKHQQPAIRLDCWEGNDFLKAYYQREGFTMLAPIHLADYSIRLFEIKIEQG
ncbi:MAG: GNAT family N-acetyltransferase [Chloroflexota bacterium]